jgi:hypothetical protein
VSYGLVSGYTVVLPDGDSGSSVCSVYRASSVADFIHERRCLFIGHIKDSLAMANWQYEQMRNTALLACH